MKLKKLTDKTLKEKYFQLRNDCIYYRGRLIDESIIVEEVIDQIIALYFCNEDYVDEMVHTVLNTEFITFYGKTQILKTILMKPEYKAFWEANNKNKGFKLIEELDKIRKLRNYLAHSKLLTDDESIKNYDGDILPLMTSVNGQQKKLKTDKAEKQIQLDRATFVIEKLLEFQQKVRPAKT